MRSAVPLFRTPATPWAMMRSPRRTAAAMPKRSPPLPSIDCRMASTLTGALFSSDEPGGFNRSDFDASIMFCRGRIGLRIGTAPINLLDSSRGMWSIHQPTNCSNRWFYFTGIRLRSNKTVTWHPIPDVLHQAYTDQRSTPNVQLSTLKVQGGERGAVRLRQGYGATGGEESSVTELQRQGMCGRKDEG